MFARIGGRILRRVTPQNDTGDLEVFRVILRRSRRIRSLHRQKGVKIVKTIWYNSPTCRVRISVIQRLPKPWRRVRFPYPAPWKGRHCGITMTAFSVIFAFGQFYWLRQLYLLRKLYCPLGSFGGEYNITAAKPQYNFCKAKISLRHSRNKT